MSRRPLAWLAVFVAGLVAAQVDAGEFAIVPVAMSVPPGFIGPNRRKVGTAVVVSYVKPYPEAHANTSLQVTIYNFRSAFAQLSEDELRAAPAKFLLDSVAAVERDRKNFSRTDPTPALIGEVPAARLQWTGSLSELGEYKDTVGVMYCAVFGSYVVTFHAQDFGTQPTENMIAAIRAIEKAKFFNERT